MQFKSLFVYFSCVALMVLAAPVEKKALRQYEIKRGEGPTPVARAEARSPSGYKRAEPAAPSGYKRAAAAAPSGYYKRVEANDPARLMRAA
ncbi:hypothetical protein CYLTODRAFT_491296 [Cylindrobasidium torrendii FP15055 ss-10]|uniref:Uncharacterized protein n=1 Tax=Cylindrobasidium torrendii FP15055 ss-10 TaxID=1314674 RepID=A0A0D7B8X3_9AGAR|nr:hypothetical protein CYLTODRAFT_491296 [Cylindrobasidium torrendii FP15055 ss-10]